MPDQKLDRIVPQVPWPWCHDCKRLGRQCPLCRVDAQRAASLSVTAPERLAAQQLYEALKDVEFKDVEFSYYTEGEGRCCPTCFEYEREEGRFCKHKPDCTLAAALAEYERVAGNVVGSSPATSIDKDRSG